MKRRTLDASKLRRPIRRSRITDSVQGSWLLYLRFFIVWLLVITMDFLLEFRFEFLWPFWLLLRSTYDSFRYQGMGLTILFLVVTMCSDLLCLVLLPVHWLFFAASTYVWVQFVWNTDRGPCLPTVILWLLFVYVEASVRLRDVKSLPFHLDLCRPFAAHCIGYPMVSLGYGFKSYVGYKIRQLKQEEVSKENEFYSHLVQYALPTDLRLTSDRGLPSRPSDDSLSLVNRKNTIPLLTNGINTKTDIEAVLTREASKRGLKLSDIKADFEEKLGTLSLSDLELISNLPSKSASFENTSKKGYSGEIENGGLKLSNGKVPTQGKSGDKKLSSKGGTSYDIEDDEISDSGESTASSGIHRSSASGSPKPAQTNGTELARETHTVDMFIGNKNAATNSKYAMLTPKLDGKMLTAIASHGQTVSEGRGIIESLQSRVREEQLSRRRLETQLSQFESDTKRLRYELHSSRQQETEVRAQLTSSYANERYLKSELARLKADNEGLQQKIIDITTSTKQDKSNISSLERKLKTEREARANADSQLKEIRKRNKLELEVANKNDSHDICISRRQELEQELITARGKIGELEQKIQDMESDNEMLKKKSQEHDSQKLKKETELLYSALSAMQGKNTHLENSLSSETRLKLDLFSALGDARRQLEIVQGQLAGKEQEVELMKAKIAEVMAISHFGNVDDIVLPTTSSSYIPVTKNGVI